jgi:hypothetical protein
MGISFAPGSTPFKPGFIGVEAVFLTARFSDQIEDYNKMLRDSYTQTKLVAEDLSGLWTDQEETQQQSLQNQVAALRNFRWQLITFMFFARQAGRIIEGVWESMGESFEANISRLSTKAAAQSIGADLADIVDSINDVTDNTVSARTATAAALTGLQADFGEFSSQYADLWRAAEVTATMSGDEVISVFGELIEAIAEGDAEAVDSTNSFYNAQSALQQYADALGVSVEELSRSERAQVILNDVLSDTQTLLTNGAEEAVNQQRSMAELKGAWQELTDVIAIGAGGMERATEVSEFFAARLETIAQLVAIVGGVFGATNAMIEEFRNQIQAPDWMPDPGKGPWAWNIIWGTAAALMPEERQKAFDAYVEEFRKRILGSAEALGDYQDTGEETAETLDTLREEQEELNETMDEFDANKAVDMLMEYEQLIEGHTQRLAEIREDYQGRRLEARRDHEEEITDAVQDAQQDRIDEIEDYEQDRIEKIDEYNLNESQKLRDHLQDIRHARERFALQQEETDNEIERRREQHLLDLEHLRQKYELRMLQSQREYEYERSLLVARGDVLGIMDLDARHEMQQQEEEENYELRRQQMIDDFELRRRQMKEELEQERDLERREFELRLRHMQENYELQRQFRQENLDQQLEQMRTALRDQLEEIDRRLREQIQAADKAYREDLQKAKEWLDDKTEQEVENFEKRKQEWQSGWAELVRTTELGADDVFQIFQNYFGNSGTIATMMGNFWTNLLEQLSILGIVERSISQSSPITPSADTRNVPAGNAGAQGGLSLGWRGGAIPVEGRGDLAQADLSGIGDAIANQIAVAISDELRGLN